MNAFASSPRPDRGPHAGEPVVPPTIVAEPTTAQVVESAVASWRSHLVAAAGGSSLADIGLLADAALDLTAAHPSGVAQLFAGRPTQLANLFREGSSLPTARRRARAVGTRAKEHAERYGVAPTYLAIGVATWTEDAPSTLAASDVAALARVAGASGAALDVDLDDPAEGPAPRRRVRMRAPVLLRPIRLHARGSGESDYELTLENTAELNPVLARALRSRGALLDPVALARGAFASGGFDPRAATERVHALGTAVLADFELVEKLIVGTFVHPGQMLVDDLDELSGLEHHEVLVALAATGSTAPEGPEGAERADAGSRGAGHATLPEAAIGDADPADERGAGDLDASQRHVLDAVAGGVSLFVDAPSGADVPGTVAAMIADAAASGRSVLYVPGHRRAAQAVVARMDELGLSELVLDVPPEPSWRAAISRRLLGAMTLEAPYVDRVALGRLRADLNDARRRLAGYVDALHLVREPWGVSAYDALQALARLTAERPAPANRVRLDLATTTRAAGERLDELAEALVRTAQLGAFSIRPTSTPWYDADLTSQDAARAAYERVERLAGELLPRLGEQIEQVVTANGLTEPVDLRAWGEQLAMLDGMRATLDVFQPIIFERTASDLVAATAPRQWRAAHGVTMGRMHRRRLLRQAKDMLRPGTRVPDLHAALRQAHTQRQVWQTYCPGGGWPRLPEGLAAIQSTYARVCADLSALEPVLAPTPEGGGLLDAPLAALCDRLERLAADRDALETLPERTALLGDLRAAGLGDLVTDLRERRVDPGLVAPELELAWWSSVFEQILAQEPVLAAYDGAGLEELAARFRALDREHVDSLGPTVVGEAVGHLTRALRNHPQETEDLFAELLEGRFTSLRDAVQRYPDLVRRLRPASIATPTLVPYLFPPTRTIDLVVLDSVQHLPLETLVPAVARGRQVVVVGDARCASGTAIAALHDVLPAISLSAQVSSRDQELVDFLARHGYDGVLRSTPLPQARALIGFDVVAGTGMPDQASGAVLTTRAEIERVVDLAITHALVRPEESLAIVTLSREHADRLREALLSEVRHNPALAGFFDPARHEPVVIADMSAVAGLSRDALILSVGFGRTPHGRVLHRFGQLSEAAGGAMLLDALGVTRARLHVVSCFTADDLDPARTRSDGARLLLDLLEFAERRAAQGATSMLSAGVETDLNPDRLVIDLAERLWRAGLTVETDYGTRGGDRIPLVVGHPDFPERFLVAVLTDDDAYVAEKSIRVRDRQVAERLEALGWTVVQVWSAAAFLDPVKEANRIRQIVLDLAARLAEDPLTGAGGFAQVLPADGGSAGAVLPGSARVEPGAEGEVFWAQVPPDAVITPPGDVDPESGAAAGTEAGADEALDAVPGERFERPGVEPGLPISAYGDDQIDELAAWIRSDGVERTPEQLAGALRAELGVVRRSNRVDTAVNAAVRRALG